MGFPSKVASYAARPLHRPRGVGAGLLRSASLRPLVRRLRSGRIGRDRAGVGAPRFAGVSPALATPSASPGSLEIEDLGDGAAHVLVLTGELDSSSIPKLEAAISRSCSEGARTITLDLSRLTFIDSSGLWTITLARKWCERHGHGFSLVRGPEPVQRVFEVTGLSDVLPFETGGSGGATSPQR